MTVDNFINKMIHIANSIGYLSAKDMIVRARAKEPNLLPKKHKYNPEVHINAMQAAVVLYLISIKATSKNLTEPLNARLKLRDIHGTYFFNVMAKAFSNPIESFSTDKGIENVLISLDRYYTEIKYKDGKVQCFSADTNFKRNEFEAYRIMNGEWLRKLSMDFSG